MWNETKRDILLTVLARGIQNTEAVSDYWDGREALYSQLSTRSRNMIESFYSNGYFIPKGAEWKAFAQACLEQTGIDVDNDYNYFEEGTQAGDGFWDQLLDAGVDDALIEDCFDFMDTFEG